LPQEEKRKLGAYANIGDIIVDIDSEYVDKIVICRATWVYFYAIAG